jgi:regulator of replication initiation timing
MDPTGITAIASLLGSLKSLVGMAKDVNHAEFNGKIIEIQQKVLDIQSKYAELQEENLSLKQSNADLTARLKRREEMRYANGAYWTKDAGPFCQHCWESEQKVVRLSRVAPRAGGEYKTSPTDIVNYTCLFHPQTRAALPIGTSDFIKKLNSQT